MTQMRFTAVFMKVPEGFIAFELPGANTQGDTLDEERKSEGTGRQTTR